MVPAHVHKQWIYSIKSSYIKLFSLLESKATYTVEEAIDKIGYGPFQVKLMLVIGLAWVSFSKGLLQDSLMIIFLL